MALAVPRLHLAAAVGDDIKIHQYITAGDHVNAREVDGETALSWAVSNGHTKCVELLLAAGADPNIRDKSQAFPLYTAAKDGHVAIAKALIKANADLNAIINRPNGGGTALLVAAFKGKQAMVKVLLHAGCDTSKITSGGHYPLSVASMEGHTDVVTMLIDAGADVNALGDNGVTALIAGVDTKGSCDVVKILLGRGADVNKNLKPRWDDCFAHGRASGI